MMRSRTAKEVSPYRRVLRGRRRLLPMVLTAALLVSAGTAHAGLEGYNRSMLRFNRWVLRNAMEPVARGYNFVMPKWAQRRVTALLANLTGPRDMVNSLLQMKPRRLATHSGRLLVNSTLGVAGLFDVGYDWFGWDAPPETFDETLGTYGVPLGPYVILPVFGDSSPRHMVGMIADGFSDPVAWFAPVFQYSPGKFLVRGMNLLASQMPSPRASEAEWDAYRRGRFDFPRYQIGRENFIADEADRVAN